MPEFTDKVLVAVDLDRFDEVAEAAQAAGLKIENRMPAIGVLHGTVSAENRQTLESVDGVESVEDERVFQLPDPDSDMQ